MSPPLDWIIIGAGPAGLACGIEAKRRDLRFLLLERGCLVNSIRHFPIDMTFFTTGELLEIGDLPLTGSSEKPGRLEVLKYYRRVTEHYQLPVHYREAVMSVEGGLNDFRVRSVDGLGQTQEYRTRRVIMAIGYYDNPNMLGIPGEELPKVSHYYSECHPYFQNRVAIIGGQNSAALVALDLYRNAKAQVTIIHRGEKMSGRVKYWVLPDINNRISRGEIQAYFSSSVLEIREKEIVVSTPEGELILENDYVFALTGYHPDVQFLEGCGIEVDQESCIPSHDPDTLETNVAGIYLAGSVASGRMTNRIFIETGRFHGTQIFRNLPEERGSLTSVR